MKIEVTTDTERIDAGRVHAWLKESYWAPNRTLEKQVKAMANSMNFGALIGGELVGFARIVTDHATFAWLADVIVDPDHRGKGVGKALMDAVVAHPDIKDMRLTYLGTRDAHGLYRRYGFNDVEPGRFMSRRIPES